MSAVQPAGACCSEETLLLMKRETGEDQSRAGGDRPELLGKEKVVGTGRLGTDFSAGPAAVGQGVMV